MKQISSSSTYIIYGMLFLCGVAWLSGCRSLNVETWSDQALIDSLANSGLADRRRLRVIDELRHRGLAPAIRVQLRTTAADIIGSPRHSPAIRLQTLDILTEMFPQAAAEHIGESLSSTREPFVRHQFVEALIRLDDPKSLTPLIEALAGEKNLQTDTAHLCLKAITDISPSPLEQTFSDRLVQSGKARHRIAALSCLVKLGSPERANRIVAAAAEDDAFMKTLQFWSGRFDYLPDNLMSYFMCELLRHRVHPDDLAILQQVAHELRRKQQYRFDISDTYLLLYTRYSRLMQGRDTLINAITGTLAPLSHTFRPASYEGAPDDYSESFIDQASELAYSDLLRIQWLLDTLEEPATVGLLDRFLRQDEADQTSEIGGLCYLRNNKVAFTIMPPGRRQGDNQYVESIETVRQGAFAFARWHCHVDAMRGAELAGPGRDDIDYARWINSPIVIVTRLDDKKMNVDLLTRTGSVIDLGNYSLN